MKEFNLNLIKFRVFFFNVFISAVNFSATPESELSAKFRDGFLYCSNEILKFLGQFQLQNPDYPQYSNQVHNGPLISSPLASKIPLVVQNNGFNPSVQNSKFSKIEIDSNEVRSKLIHHLANCYSNLSKNSQPSFSPQSIQNPPESIPNCYSNGSRINSYPNYLNPQIPISRVNPYLFSSENRAKNFRNLNHSEQQKFTNFLPDSKQIEPSQIKQEFNLLQSMNNLSVPRRSSGSSTNSSLISPSEFLMPTQNSNSSGPNSQLENTFQIHEETIKFTKKSSNFLMIPKEDGLWRPW